MQSLIEAKDKHIGMFTITEMMPFLVIIEKQNGLNINRNREFYICRKILVKSILYN